MGVMAGLYIGLGLGLRHALDADHVVAVTSMLSDGRRLRSALAVGFWWGTGHGITLVVAGMLALAAGIRVPPQWQGVVEAGVGVMILGLGATLLLRHWRGSVHWHEHRHAGSAHAHFHRHDGAGQRPHDIQTGEAHGHDHSGPGRLRATIVGAIHGLAGTGPLVILLLVAFAEPSERYAALAASAVGTVAGMIVVTACLAFPFAWSRQLGPVWYARMQVGAGALGVLFGMTLAVRALGTG